MAGIRPIAERIIRGRLLLRQARPGWMTEGRSIVSDGHNSRSRGRPGWLRGRSLLAGLVSTATVAAFLTAAGTANAVTSTSPIGAAGIVPSGAARIGTVPGSTKVSIDVVLNPGNAAGLSRYATEVATPGSSLYHRYLAKGQFARLFGASGATINSVLSCLRTLGLRPGAVASDHLSIPVTATASQLESARLLEHQRSQAARLDRRQRRGHSRPRQHHTAAALQLRAERGLARGSQRLEDPPGGRANRRTAAVRPVVWRSRRHGCLHGR
jgi:Pro-kumamolisin, activation domain